ncbi:MAG: response regulator, partial [Glaciimonas sp.]|nr:response regulator [Glaciimonas sp.]
VMPGQNGFQVTRSITKTPEFQDIPVIMCTSKGLETDRIWGMRQGAKDYLVKPIDPKELLSKIAALGAV